MTNKLTEELLKEVAARKAINPQAKTMTLKAGDDKHKISVGAYTFDKKFFDIIDAKKKNPKYFGAKYDGKHVLPLGKDGDGCIVDEIVEFLSKNKGLTLSQKQETGYTDLLQRFYFFKDRNRFDRLFPVALKKAQITKNIEQALEEAAQNELQNQVATVSADTASLKSDLEEHKTSTSNQFSDVKQLFIATDKTFNGVSQNVDRLYRTVDGLSQNVDALAKAGVETRQQMSALCKLVGNHETRLNGHDGQLETHGERLQQHDGRIGNVETQQAEMEQKQQEMLEALVALQKEQIDSVAVQEQASTAAPPTKKRPAEELSNEKDTAMVVSDAEDRVVTSQPEAKKQKTASDSVKSFPVLQELAGKILLKMAKVRELSFDKSSLVEDQAEFEKLKGEVKALHKELEDFFKVVSSKDPDKKWKKACHKAITGYIQSSKKMNKHFWKKKDVKDMRDSLKEAYHSIIDTMPYLPLYKGEVYRAMDGGDVDYYTAAKIEEKLQVGSIHHELGFASTSMLSFAQQRQVQGCKAFAGRGCLMTMHSKTGRIIQPFASDNFWNEWEVIIAPGTEFRVTEHEKVGEQYCITMEEIVKGDA